MKQQRIAFIGAGNMASCLIGGLIKGGYNPQKIIASNPSPEKLIVLKTKFQINICENNLDAIAEADVIVLCIKPNKMAEVTKELSTKINPKQLTLSIAAGIQTQQIQQWLESKSPVIRCMPNTPSLLGVGASGLFANKFTNAEQKQFAESIMRSVGLTIWVDAEEQVDTVTALSGSGPAYFLLVFEALVKAAQEQGLEEEQAKLLTLQTALGAARMAMESPDSISELRNKVTSPGGTTEYALNVLKQNNLESIFADALAAAKARAEDMSSIFAAGENKAIEQK